MKNIEVELRGPLNDSEYERVCALLKKSGRLLKVQKRFFFDYSTFLEGVGERKSDIRYRVTDGRGEIIAKRGVFGSASREEVSVFLEKSSLENALRLMSFLGYTKAVVCNRMMARYEIEGIEFVIQDVLDFRDSKKVHSRFFEAEIMAGNEVEKEKAVKKIQNFLSNNALEVFPEEAWYEYIARINKEANGVFDYSTDSIDVIQKLEE